MYSPVSTTSAAAVVSPRLSAIFARAGRQHSRGHTESRGFRSRRFLPASAVFRRRGVGLCACENSALANLRPQVAELLAKSTLRGRHLAASLQPMPRSLFERSTAGLLVAWIMTRLVACDVRWLLVIEFYSQVRHRRRRRRRHREATHAQFSGFGLQSTDSTSRIGGRSCNPLPYGWKSGYRGNHFPVTAAGKFWPLKPRWNTSATALRKSTA